MKQRYKKLFNEPKIIRLSIFWVVMIVFRVGLAEPSDPPLSTSTEQGAVVKEVITGQKVMQVFDFEEREINYLDLPMYWRKYAAPDEDHFPHYSSAALDTTHAKSGTYSFKLISEGGSVGFEHDSRRIRVKPGCDFQVTGYVYLENCRTAKAQIRCAFTDRTGKVIPKSEFYSNLVGPGEGSADGWALVDVYAPGNFPEARFLTLSVWLLQQEEWSKNAGSAMIFRRDVSATVWFDDIAIYQLPRVILRTPVLGNVFDGDQPSRLEVEVQGISASDYHVELTVEDATQHPIRREAWILTGVDGAQKVTRIDMPDFPAGLYRVQLQVRSGRLLVATRNLTFIKLQNLTSGRGAGGMDFGVVATGEGVGDWDTLHRLTQLTEVKLLKYPVWRANGQSGSIASEPDFDRKLLELQQQRIEMVASFAEAPDSLSAKLDIGHRGLLDCLSQDVEVWRSQLAYVLSQYARQISYWQVGADEHRRIASWDPRIRPILGLLREEFSKLVSHIILAAPLNGVYEVNSNQLGTTQISLGINAAIIPAEIPAYVTDARKRGMQRIWLTLEPLDMTEYNRDGVLIDFAQRIAYAKQSQADAIFIECPWFQHMVNSRLATEPAEVFLILRTMAHYLGGTKFLAAFDLAEDVEAMIFEREGSGCLFVWSRGIQGASEAPREIRLVLGDQPEMVDLFGNRTLLPTVNGVSTLRLTHWPVLLTEVDTHLAVMRSGLKLTPHIIEASIMRQEMILSLKNPFNAPITGRIHLLLEHGDNQDWIVEPMVSHFSLQPRETFEQPLSFKFPRNELGGKKQLDIAFNIDADRNYQFRASVPFEVRLLGLDVNIFTRRVNDKDMLIQQVITNEGEEEVALNSFVDLPDRDHLERVIPHLQPGSSVTKSYLIPEASQWLGQTIRVGLYDPKGTKRINYHVDIN